MTRIATHPGEIISEEYLKPLGISIRALSDAIDVPPNRIAAIIKGTRSVTADTAIRLGRYFRTSSEFWTNLQTAYDLSKANSEHSYKEIKPREY